MAATTSPRRTHNRARRVLHDVVVPSWPRAAGALMVELLALALRLPFLVHLVIAVLVHVLLAVWL